MQSIWNPWRELSNRPHLTLVWVERGRQGCINFATSTITLCRGMEFEERRSVISHELIHDERGPVPRWLKPREESQVRQESARRLIDIYELAEVLRWTRRIEEAAQDLRVDVPTLQARLDHLHPSERGLLKRALGEDDE